MRAARVLRISLLLFALNAAGAASAGDVWVVGGEAGIPVKMPAAASAPLEFSASTDDEFFDAIGSDRIVTLGTGQFAIGTRWPEGTFEGLNNFTLRGTPTGGGGTMTDLTAYRARDPIIEFKNCQNLTIEYVVAGHMAGAEPGGAAFVFENCRNVVLKNVEMYQSDGALRLAGVTDFDAESCVVFDCEGTLVSVTGSKGVTFKNCVFSGNREDAIVGLDAASGVVIFTGTQFKGNKSGEPELNAGNVTYDGCSFE